MHVKMPSNERDTLFLPAERDMLPNLNSKLMLQFCNTNKTAAMTMSGRPGINNQSDSLMSDTEIIASKGVREGMREKEEGI